MKPEDYPEPGDTVPLVECEKCDQRAKTLGDAEVVCVVNGCGGMMVQVGEVTL